MGVWRGGVSGEIRYVLCPFSGPEEWPEPSSLNQLFLAKAATHNVHSSYSVWAPKNSLPFTPKFLQINSPPGFLYFFVIFTGIHCGMDIAQKPNKSGQILDQRWKIFFVISTKLSPRRIFFVLQKFC